MFGSSYDQKHIGCFLKHSVEAGKTAQQFVCGTCNIAELQIIAPLADCFNTLALIQTPLKFTHTPNFLGYLQN